MRKIDWPYVFLAIALTCAAIVLLCTSPAKSQGYTYSWFLENEKNYYTIELHESCEKDIKAGFIVCYDRNGKDVASYRMHSAVTLGKSFTQRNLKARSNDSSKVKTHNSHMKTRLFEYVNGIWGKREPSVTSVTSQVIITNQGVAMIVGFATLEVEFESIGLIVAQVWSRGQADEVVITFDGGTALERNLRISLDVLDRMTLKEK